MLKNEGPIPEGEYYITPLSENINDGVQYWDKIGCWQQSLSIINAGQWGYGSISWGKIRIPIQPKTKILTDSKGQTITRNNFFIHGGLCAGSAGCIDLWRNNALFFKTLYKIYFAFSIKSFYCFVLDNKCWTLTKEQVKKDKEVILKWVMN